MHLLSVKLINWRSYRNASFSFPRPHGNKNVILITAPNEYGKTSFFEAVTLGIFGRDGLFLIPRIRTEDRRKESYSSFLQGVLHSRALESGAPVCSVELEWEDEDGEPIEIRRRWHFRNNGSHRVGDDETIIYRGRRRKPVEPPASEEDREAWMRDYIVQRFLAPHLAEFFLFDGEQVQRYANRDMRDQVRRGVEGLLGLPILRELKNSLEGYAQRRRSRVAKPSDTVVQDVNDRIEKLERKIAEEDERQSNADKGLANIVDEFNDLTQRLNGRGEGTVSLLKALMEDAERYRHDADREFASLTDLLSGDVALAVAGPELRDNTIDRLQSEATRQAWEAGRDEGSRNLDRFAADLSERIARLDPPILGSYQEGVIAAAKAAWQALWHPPPDDCADDYLHAALAGPTRARTIDRLKAVGELAAVEVSRHVERFHTARDRAAAKRREALEVEQVSPDIEKWAARLSELSELRGKYFEQRDAASRAIEAARAELADRRAELGRYVSQLNARAPELAYAELADAYAGLIDRLLDVAVPHEVGEVAKEMTTAWKSMAHHSDRVDRIEISPDCEVRMLAIDGTDLHAIEKSAGANQIFTQALIAALTKVSRRTFPFIVDTPLARLSLEQRLGVLRTFTDRSGQVILLSTDQEIVEDKLDAIRHRIAADYELKLTFDGGVAVTTVHSTDPGKE